MRPTVERLARVSFGTSVCMGTLWNRASVGHRLHGMSRRRFATALKPSRCFNAMVCLASPWQAQGVHLGESLQELELGGSPVAAGLPQSCLLVLLPNDCATCAFYVCRKPDLGPTPRRSQAGHSLTPNRPPQPPGRTPNESRRHPRGRVLQDRWVLGRHGGDGFEAGGGCGAAGSK